MIIIPKEKPVVEKLNSYYLDIKRLLEHYQGEMDSGCIHFKSTSAEGVIFFDKDDLLSGIFQDKDGETKGIDVIEHIIEAVANNSFAVSIYYIEPDKIYFWANLHNAEVLYKDLSTDFTDLNGLRKKMSSEKLTGYIEVSIDKGKEGGLIFFHDGQIVGCSYSWEKGKLKSTKADLELLTQKSKESGGIFNVRTISLKKTGLFSPSENGIQKVTSRTIDMIQQLLFIFEKAVRKNSKITTDFDMLLKKKFVEKADKYDFLDPFAAEFQYTEDRVQFTGNASDKQLSNGIAESVKELADDLGMLPQLLDDLVPWKKKYSQEIDDLGIII